MKLQKDDVARMWSFHHWATGRAFDALAALTPEELDRKWGGSFATARGLLKHIVGADQLWIERLNGYSPRAMPEFPGSYAGQQFRDEWRKLEARERTFIEALTPAQLAKDLTYTNLKGVTSTWPLADVLYHIVNHGTYHRGQITHLLRDLGKDAPGTDYVLYLAL
jgi:uncharacterized damage-inducible protein DinB